MTTSDTVHHYRGNDRLGQARVGSVFTIDLIKFVGTRYMNGWRFLVVTNHAGVVAKIEVVDGRRRMWIQDDLPMV